MRQGKPLDANHKKHNASYSTLKKPEIFSTNATALQISVKSGTSVRPAREKSSVRVSMVYGAIKDGRRKGLGWNELKGLGLVRGGLGTCATREMNDLMRCMPDGGSDSHVTKRVEIAKRWRQC